MGVEPDGVEGLDPQIAGEGEGVVLGLVPCRKHGAGGERGEEVATAELGGGEEATVIGWGKSGAGGGVGRGEGE